MSYAQRTPVGQTHGRLSSYRELHAGWMRARIDQGATDRFDLRHHAIQLVRC